MSDDIVSGTSKDYVIVGFFTPNYRALAETFATNLAAFNQPFHLYAVPPVAEWASATLLKPSIVLRAMDDYQGRTIVFSDVDCTIHACLENLTLIDGDVSLHVRAWTQDRVYPYSCASSRLTVFKPTKKARELAECWREINETTQSRNDEACLTMALWRVMDLRIVTMPSVIGEGEKAFVRHPTVTHESAHTSVIGRSQKPLSRGLKRWKRAIFKFFTGRDYDKWRYRGTRPSN